MRIQPKYKYAINVLVQISFFPLWDQFHLYLNHIWTPSFYFNYVPYRKVCTAFGWSLQKADLQVLVFSDNILCGFICVLLSFLEAGASLQPISSLFRSHLIHELSPSRLYSRTNLGLLGMAESWELHIICTKFLHFITTVLGWSERALLCQTGTYSWFTG